MDRVHGQRALDRDEAAEGGVDRFELEAGETVADGIDSGAAITLEVHSEQAEAAELRRDLAGESALFEPLLDPREKLGGGEAPHGGLEHALLVREQPADPEKIGRV